MSTALALSLIGALCVLSLGTAAWSVALHLARRNEPSAAHLEQVVTALRLEVADLVDKFTAQQKRNAVRAMREKADAAAADDTPLDPAAAKRALRQRFFGGGNP